MCTEKLTKLLAYVKENGRICPNPQEWLALWEMLPEKERIGTGWNPPLPLILAAWSEPAVFKALRLEEHIRYASDHHDFEKIDEYLRNLKPNQWFSIKQ